MRRQAMPRRRARKNRDLPDNLYYTTRPDGKVYYYFRHPVTNEVFGIGEDRQDAISQVRETNQIIGYNDGTLLRRVAGEHSITLAKHIDRYQREILPRRRVKGKPLSKRYLAETRRILARISDALGDKPMAEIRQREIAAYLAGIDSSDAHNQHRVRLIQLWRQAMSDEIVTENLPDRVMPRDLSERRRSRLTLDQYRAIFAEARPAIQVAMELSLNSLQRRTDVQKWRFADQREGYAHVIQSKTRKHGPSAWLRIPLDLPTAHSELGCRTLGEIIGHARSDGVVCPFVVHEQPAKLRKSKEKEHPFQLTHRAISQGFADARNATGLFDRMHPAERPTFHELISLGQHLREQQDWTIEQIQRLRGHTSAGMTEHYQEGHSWTTVKIDGGSY